MKSTYVKITSRMHICTLTFQMISLDKEKFERADRNKDGNLNEAEYSAFLHPYNHDHMRDLELKEILLDYDKNKDGAISFDEFLGDAEGYLFFVK